MSFDLYHLMEHLLLQVVQKCQSPEIYVRLRQTCRRIEDLCERSRDKINIPLDAHICLYFTNSEIRLTANDTSAPLPSLCAPSVMINYGGNGQKITYQCEMTEDNVSKIREAISGFKFGSIFVNNGHVPDEHYPEFLRCLNLFLDVAKGTRSLYLAVKGIDRESLGLLLSKFKSVALEVANYNEELMNSQYLQDTQLRGVCLKFDQDARDFNLANLLSSKEMCVVTNFPLETFWIHIAAIVKNWNTLYKKLILFEFYFPQLRAGEIPEYQAGLAKAGANLICSHKHVALGNGHLPSYEKDITYDYWIIKLDEQLGRKRYGYIKICRSDTYLAVDVWRRTSADELFYPFEIVRNIFQYSVPLDFSELAKAIDEKKVTPDDMKDLTKALIQNIRNIYSD